MPYDQEDHDRALPALERDMRRAPSAAGGNVSRRRLLQATAHLFLLLWVLLLCYVLGAYIVYVFWK